jgi:hypothetical protein
MAFDYAEPGYSTPLKGIVFANWNEFSHEVFNLLEKYGYSCEWEDEWSTCNDCGNAVRISPNCYSWQPSYVILYDCKVVCVDCLEDRAEDYLESLENKPWTAVNLPQIDPEDYGYTALPGEYEGGLNSSVDPSEIYKKLKAEGHKRILFQITNVGQFDIGFKAWTKRNSRETI